MGHRSLQCTKELNKTQPNSRDRASSAINKPYRIIQVQRPIAGNGQRPMANGGPPIPKPRIRTSRSNYEVVRNQVNGCRSPQPNNNLEQRPDRFTATDSSTEPAFHYLHSRRRSSQNEGREAKSVHWSHDVDTSPAHHRKTPTQLSPSAKYNIKSSQGNTIPVAEPLVTPVKAEHRTLPPISTTSPLTYSPPYQQATQRSVSTNTRSPHARTHSHQHSTNSQFPTTLSAFVANRSSRRQSSLANDQSTPRSSVDAATYTCDRMDPPPRDRIPPSPSIELVDLPRSRTFHGTSSPSTFNANSPTYRPQVITRQPRNSRLDGKQSQYQQPQPKPIPRSISLHQHQSSSPSQSGLQKQQVKQRMIPDKLLLRIYQPDRTTTVVPVGETTTALEIMQLMARQNQLSLDMKQTMVEKIPELRLERCFEDDEIILGCLLDWKMYNQNVLFVEPREATFGIFSYPQIWLNGKVHPQLEKMNSSIFKELFCSYRESSLPMHSDFLYSRINDSKHKAKWKRQFFMLRSTGLYFSKRKSGNTGSRLARNYDNRLRLVQQYGSTSFLQSINDFLTDDPKDHVDNQRWLQRSASSSMASQGRQSIRPCSQMQRRQRSQSTTMPSVLRHSTSEIVDRRSSSASSSSTSRPGTSLSSLLCASSASSLRSLFGKSATSTSQDRQQHGRKMVRRSQSSRSDRDASPRSSSRPRRGPLLGPAARRCNNRGSHTVGKVSAPFGTTVPDWVTVQQRRSEQNQFIEHQPPTDIDNLSDEVFYDESEL